ncbi:DUF6163 family protein [Ensifer soli]|uniref:DUF6163 family protein n=1 Tax=Ciceribacter sp. sgz301302 TaxID=3342379 RepID=UPI0035B7A54C
MVDDSVHVPKPLLVETLLGLLLRLVAVFGLWFGLSYWAMLIGFSYGGRGRFDLLQPAWRAGATVLAVVYPVASVGLWLKVSWGPVLWVVAAVVEIVLFEFYPTAFGTKPLLVAMHAAIATCFIVFRLAVAYRRLVQARRVSTDSP